MVNKKVKIFIISEDTGKNSFQIVKNIVEKSFLGLNYKISQKFEYSDELNNEQNVKAANWKNRNDCHFRQFMQKLKSKLYNNVFIIWHIDADVIWENYNKSDNIKKFKKFIDKIKNTPSPRNGKIIQVDLTKKIINMFPAYSIEAWLYPFYKKVEEINKKDFKLKNIPIDEFDDIEKIKDKSGINDKYNLQLSKQISFKRLNNVGKSYSKFIEDLKENSELMEMIKTYLSEK